MTEAEWLSASAPRPMLKALGKRFAGRKQRLFVCGIGRILWDHMLEPFGELIHLQERFIDGELEPEDYRAQERQVLKAIDESQLWNVPTTPTADAAWNVVEAVISFDAVNAVRAALEWGEVIAAQAKTRDAFRTQVCGLVRELFPPLPRVYAHQPEFFGGGLLLPDGSTFHLPDTARSIALGVQQDQAFDRLPILADALEDANCRDRPLLDHLRHGQNHRRGCWALDVALGRG